MSSPSPRSFSLRRSPVSPRRLADVGIALLVMLVVGMMILPLPTPLLDLLLATNISLGVLLVLVSLYVPNAISFASFPTVLLVTTLYRLALNVSSTRLILLQADAGEVIRAFGKFVVGGNYVVGAVVFLILTLIQFIVIAKGSERVAEVSARFTLDAMPGKQMSIDAEQRSGALSHDEAKRRRTALARESQFYGAMDGAMKFVKGDAIAGIVITLVNVLGGLAIGVVMRGMPVASALKTYSLLTIGDGLVSQIPALLISTAAGLVVTRVASESDDASLGADVAAQIFGDARALAIAAAFLVGLSVVPGLPTLPFLVLGATFGALAYAQRKKRPARLADAPRAAGTQARSADATRTATAFAPGVAPVSLDLGETLGRRVLGPDGSSGELLERALPAAREALFQELGLVLPAVRTRVVSALDPDTFVVSLQEVAATTVALPEDRTLVADEVSVLVARGWSAVAVEGAFVRAPLALVPTAAASAARPALDVVAEADLIADTIARVVRRRGHELLGIQETQTMLDALEREYPALVRSVVPKPLSVPLLADVLRRLLEEGVSIRPLREILEALATFGATERDPIVLTELVRAAMKRAIAQRHAPHGTLAVFLLDPTIESAIRDGIQRTPAGTYLALAPDVTRDIVMAIRRAVDGTPSPVLLTQSDVRRFVRRLVELDLPDVTALSYQELPPELVVQPLGRVSA